MKQQTPAAPEKFNKATHRAPFLIGQLATAEVGLGVQESAMR